MTRRGRNSNGISCSESRPAWMDRPAGEEKSQSRPDAHVVSEGM